MAKARRGVRQWEQWEQGYIGCNYLDLNNL